MRAEEECAPSLPVVRIRSLREEWKTGLELFLFQYGISERVRPFTVFDVISCCFDVLLLARLVLPTLLPVQWWL